jgi:hypothetical protein
LLNPVPWSGRATARRDRREHAKGGTMSCATQRQNRGSPLNRDPFALMSDVFCACHGDG